MAWRVTMTRAAMGIMIMLVLFAVPTITAANRDLNDLVRLYSTQRIVELDINETCTFKLKDGRQRVLRLVSVEEQRDSVVDLVRRASVRVTIDGKPLDLLCEPCRMPTEIDGLRLQADTTSGYGNIEKRVQLSLWDAADPIVDATRFVFPLQNYRLFSHGTQAYNEPVYLGTGDDDPAGQKFYHDYGFDMAGFEGGEPVFSAIEGDVVYFWPNRDNICSILVQDRNGFVLEHVHLNAVEPNIVLNTHVAAGEKIGTLGKTGPSGNFSHLHVGTYLQLGDTSLKPGDPDNPNRRLNLYPWLVTAYQAVHPKGLLAVARPHHIVLAGDKIVFDGSNSLVWGGNKITRWSWEFPDGQTVDQVRAEKVFDRPGSYVATLRIKDNQGNEDVDFCQIKVFSRDNTEKNMPHIFMSYTPTEDIRPNEPVRFRFWRQGTDGRSMRVVFSDGTQLDAYQSDSEFTHAFKNPGLYIVTAQCDVDGKPMMQRLKVVVNSPHKLK